MHPKPSMSAKRRVAFDRLGDPPAGQSNRTQKRSQSRCCPGRQAAILPTGCSKQRWLQHTMQSMHRLRGLSLRLTPCLSAESDPPPLIKSQHTPMAAKNAIPPTSKPSNQQIAIAGVIKNGGVGRIAESITRIRIH